MAMGNCSVCGKLFNRVRDRICPACLAAEEAEFDKVLAYIREKGARMVPEIADGTDVDVTKIQQWVREGKLKLAKSDTPVEHGCRSCGKPVESGEICEKCRKKLASGIAAARANASTPQQTAPAAGPAPAPKGGMHSRGE